MIIRRITDDELYHHGIKGQKWGVRRYQNADGSLTAAGKVRYGYGGRLENRIEQDYKKNSGTMSKTDSAEITMRKAQREKAVQNAVTGGVLGAGVGAGAINAARASVKAGVANIKNASNAANYNFNLSERLMDAAFDKGGDAFRNFSFNNVPQVKPLVESAISSMNPIALSVAAAAGITAAGYGLYNVYKNYKMAEISDKYQIPDSKRVRRA